MGLLGEVLAAFFIFDLFLLLILGLLASFDDWLQRWKPFVKHRGLRINKAVHSTLTGLTVLALLVVAFVDPATAGLKSALEWSTRQSLWLQAAFFLAFSYVVLGVAFRLGALAVNQVKEPLQDLTREIEQLLRPELSADEEATLNYRYQ